MTSCRVVAVYEPYKTIKSGAGNVIGHALRSDFDDFVSLRSADFRFVECSMGEAVRSGDQAASNLFGAENGPRAGHYA